MADIRIASPTEAPHTRFLRCASRDGIVLDQRPDGGLGFPPRLYGGDPPPEPATATTGRVVSATRVFGRETSHVLALIDLDPAGRLLARLASAEPEDRLIGRAVRLKTADERGPGEPFLTFVTCEVAR